VKTCRKCGKDKKQSEFRLNRRMRDGLSSWCAACHREATGGGGPTTATRSTRPAALFRGSCMTQRAGGPFRTVAAAEVEGAVRKPGAAEGSPCPMLFPPGGDGGSCPAPSRRLFPPAGGQNQPSRGAPTTQQFGRLPAGLVERAARRRLHFGRLTRLVPGRLGTSITAPTAPAISAPRTGGAIASRGRETASRWRTLAAARTSP
jgi:hypothetical protein